MSNHSTEISQRTHTRHTPSCFLDTLSHTAPCSSYLYFTRDQGHLRWRPLLADFGLLGGTVGSFAFVVLDLALGGFASLALADAPSSSSAQCTTHHG